MKNNKEIVTQMYDSVGAGDMDAVYDVMSEEILWINHSPENSNLRGEYTGIDGVKDFFDRLMSSAVPLRLEILDLIAEGDWVLARISGTYKNPKTDYQEDTTLAHLFKIVDGKVESFEDWPGVTSKLFE
jgi:ketosteroid isomerase-like protein